MEKLYLRSRNNKDFADRYPKLLKGLQGLPNETVIDGEVVAFDQSGRPSFNVLQNSASGQAELVYYVYDVTVLAGKDVMSEPLDKRRAMLEEKVLPKLTEPVRYSQSLDVRLEDLIVSVKAAGLEGLVAKKGSSRYEPGIRSGAWQKMGIQTGQEFVIGGYTVGEATFDALVFGYYEGNQLLYAARTRNGFTPGLRAALFRKLRPLEISKCPFANLRNEEGPMGTRANRREDERVPLGQTASRRPI
jgi:ATP-dependent DNA ligase